MPANAAVAREEQDADAAADERPFLPTDGPADRLVEEADAAERGFGAGDLVLPRFAAVDRMADDAVVADGPAFLGVDEADAVESGILAMLDGSGRQSAALGEERCREDPNSNEKLPPWSRSVEIRAATVRLDPRIRKASSAA